MSFLSYVSLKTMIYLDSPLPEIATSYLADLLCMPIVLSIILFFIRWVKKDEGKKLSIGTIMLICLYWMIYFEYYLPMNDTQYTSDIGDVILYFVGALSFIYWQHKTVVQEA